MSHFMRKISFGKHLFEWAHRKRKTEQTEEREKKTKKKKKAAAAKSIDTKPWLRIPNMHVNSIWRGNGKIVTVSKIYVFEQCVQAQMQTETQTEAHTHTFTVPKNKNDNLIV